MLRIKLDEQQWRLYFRTFIFTDEECLESNKEASQLYEIMERNIQKLIHHLESKNFNVGFEDSDDIFVNYDLFRQWLIHTDLSADSRLLEIERAIHQACFELTPGVGIVLNVHNPTIPPCERSLITRQGVFFTDQWTD